MLNVGIIGLGNAGNQVADLAAETAGIEGIAINSSEKDLANVENVATLKIGDAKGAGKDRDEAKKFIKERIRDFIADDSIVAFFMDKDVIFVVTSIDGGTGSGSTPVFLSVMEKTFPDVKFILVPIYPSLVQSPAALQNSIEFLQEVNTNIPNATCLSFNNDKFSSLSSDQMIKNVNEAIVEAIKVIRMDYNYSTPFDSIDEKDLEKIITMPGELFVGIYDGFTEADLDEESIEDHLIKIVKGNSAQVDMERDKIVKCFGVISNLDEELRDKFDNKLTKLKDVVGKEVMMFSHYYVNDMAVNTKNRVVIIMSGLSVPDTTISSIVEAIKEAEKKLTKTRKSSVLNSADVSTIAGLRKQNTENAVTEVDIDSIFDQF